MRYYDTGDIVIDDTGRTLEITSGNAKWQDQEGTFVWSINAPYVRAKEVKQAVTLWDLADIDQDFIWYVDRIVKIKEKAKCKA